MPMDRWPCVPDSIADVLSVATIELLVAGASQMQDRLIMLAEMHGDDIVMYNPPDRFKWYGPFCRVLRADGAVEEERERHGIRPSCLLDGGDEACEHFDQATVRRLLAELRPGAAAPHVYPCYMGLLELALLLEVGGHRFLAVSGQFAPAEGNDPIVARLDAWQQRLPNPPLFSCRADPLSGEALATFEKYASNVVPTTGGVQELTERLRELEPLTDKHQRAFHEQAKSLEKVIQEHHERAKLALKDELAATVRLIPPALRPALDRSIEERKATDKALRELRQVFGASYCALFALTRRPHEGEAGAILSLSGQSGLDRQIEANPPHLNWRKAGLPGPEEMARVSPPHASEPLFGGDARRVAEDGISGGPHASVFSDAWICYPWADAQNLRAVLMLGPPQEDARTDAASLLKTLVPGILAPFFMLQEVAVSNQLQEDWESTSKVTGHRVRACLQGIENVLKIIRDHEAGEPWATREQRDQAIVRLEQIVGNIRATSDHAELEGLAALDPSVSMREIVPFSEIVWEAIEDFAAYATEQGMLLAPYRLDMLDQVYVDRTLTKIAVANLLDNAIKYSSNPRDGSERTVKVTNVSAREGGPAIEVENFGRGILIGDRERIFERGVRLAAEAPGPPRAARGAGLGLWEARRIIEAQGGSIEVMSASYDGTEVREDDIDRCITRFTVSLPPYPGGRKGRKT